LSFLGGRKTVGTQSEKINSKYFALKDLLLKCDLCARQKRMIFEKSIESLFERKSLKVVIFREFAKLFSKIMSKHITNLRNGAGVFAYFCRITKVKRG